MITIMRSITLTLILGSLLSGCQQPASTTNDPLSSKSADSATSDKPAINIINDSQPGAESNTDTQEWTACPEERAEVCTQIYQPVCASLDTGIRCVTTPCPAETTQTFGNACTACADPRAFGYSPGECKSGQQSNDAPADSPNEPRE